ncbi:MAG: succinic semialdehyde dehydrogenase [Micromonosporaceae bacterium]
MTTTAAPVLAVPPSITPELVRRLAALVVSGDAETYQTLHVFTGEPLAEIPLSTVDDVRQAVSTARAAQPAWAATPIRQRAAIVRRLVELIHDDREFISDLIQAETGKSRLHAFFEQLDPLLCGNYYARKAAKLLKPRRRTGMFPLVASAREHHVPKGVVGIIAPWNFPFALALNDAIAALLAGNAVVLKPDLQTALSPLYGVELARRAGVPAEVFQVVLGDGPVIGPAVVEQVDYVGFTGSSRTGRDVARRSGARLVGCSLELGGKNPMLVLSDADLERAVGSAVSGTFTNAGQICVGIERIYVEQPIYQEFLSRFTDAVSALRLGASYDDLDVDLGSLISAAQLERVSRHVEDARAKGATVELGGRPRPDIGPYFYEPTVLTGVTPEMVCHAEETFGPVVSVYPVADEAEAIARANDTEYGLNASVFTRSARRGERVGGAIKAGTVNINDGFGTAYGSIDTPMGGMRASGLGRRHGVEGLLKYTDTQTLARLRFAVVDPPPNQPRETYVKMTAGAIRWLGRARIR